MKKLMFITTTVLFMTFSGNVVAQDTVVDIAVGNEDFSTLVTALKAADLVGALNSEGPFTVFAPTNDAFAKIDSKTLNSLLEIENKKSLANILTYHVIEGKIVDSPLPDKLTGYMEPPEDFEDGNNDTLTDND